MKSLFLIFSIISFLSLKALCMQERTYELLSLENKICTIHLAEAFPKDLIILTLDNKDTMIITGSRGISQEVRIVDKKFMELHYAIRGGTGVALRQDVLVCISNNKLQKCLNLYASVISNFDKTYVPSIDSLHMYDEHSVYEFKIIDILENKERCLLKASEYDMIRSKHDPKTNHEIRDTLSLSFDIVDKIFFNETETLQGKFNFIDINGHSVSKICMEVKAGVINTRLYKYYFINDKWFYKEKEGFQEIE